VSRPAVEVVLPKGGPTVVLAELGATEVLLALRAAGGHANDLAARLECVRASLRRVNGTEVTPADVAGALLQKLVPRSRHHLQLCTAWGRIHEPDEEQIDAVKASVSIDVGEVESWTVTLPDGRRVTLVEQPLETVGEALRAKAKNPSAQQLQAALGALRRSVRAVDGRAVVAEELDGKGWDRLFSFRETLLLAVVWQDMQVGDQEDLEALGEAIRAGGTR